MLETESARLRGCTNSIKFWWVTASSSFSKGSFLQSTTNTEPLESETINSLLEDSWEDIEHNGYAKEITKAVGGEDFAEDTELVKNASYSAPDFGRRSQTIKFLSSVCT